MTNAPEAISKLYSDSRSGLRAVPATKPSEITKNAPVAFPEALAGRATQLIASWQKNSRETLLVKLDSFKGHAVIDCRAWYLGASGELQPGRGGLTISVKHLPALAGALAKALDVATKAGLLDSLDGGGV